WRPLLQPVLVAGGFPRPRQPRRLVRVLADQFAPECGSGHRLVQSNRGTVPAPERSICWKQNGCRPSDRGHTAGKLPPGPGIWRLRVSYSTTSIPVNLPAIAPAQSLQTTSRLFGDPRPRRSPGQHLQDLAGLNGADALEDLDGPPGPQVFAAQSGYANLGE